MLVVQLRFVQSSTNIQSKVCIMTLNMWKGVSYSLVVLHLAYLYKVLKDFLEGKANWPKRTIPYPW